MASNQAALRLRAFFTTDFSHSNIAGQPMMFEFNATLPTVEEAAEFAAQFPKSTKVFATKLNTADGIKGWVVGTARLDSDKVNGGTNETGLRRYRAIVKAAAKLGIEIEYAKTALNSYETREAFEEAIGA